MLPSRAVHAPTHPTPSQPAPHSPVPPRQIHVKNLKPSPAANPLVNRCIECGFCESNCPSRDITLTPRQRIAVYKELFRLRQMENRTPEQQVGMPRGLQSAIGGKQAGLSRQRHCPARCLRPGQCNHCMEANLRTSCPLQARLDEMAAIFEYDGQDTCAAGEGQGQRLLRWAR